VGVQAETVVVPLASRWLYGDDTTNDPPSSKDR